MNRGPQGHTRVVSIKGKNVLKGSGEATHHLLTSKGFEVRYQGQKLYVANFPSV